MASVRRTRHAFFHLEDDRVLDIAWLLGGDVPLTRSDPQLLALALLTGERHPLTQAELDVLMSVPADDWVEREPRHAGLVDKALLISDDGDPRLVAIRQRDEAFTATQWDPHAALYHQMTRWGGVDVRGGGEPELGAESRAAARMFVERHGPPPGPFRDPRPGPTLELPDGARSGGLYSALAARRTTRAFDTSRAMTIEELSSVLHHVFGCHGYATTIAGVVCIKRTSPSGGGLHPIEAYPVVTRVSGLAPGIYHYDPSRHALVLIAELDRDDARNTATSFMCGQSYFGAAHVSFVLTARFYRNHWKYRRHQKAYAAILMDAAHLSQTLYLVSAEMGLGAFVTSAINARDIDDRLGLDGVTEGVVAISGCGRPASGASSLELDFKDDPPDGGAI